MYLLLIIHLIILGLIIAFMTKVVAVVYNNDCLAEITNRHVFIAILIGLVPVINLVFLYSGFIVLKSINRLQEDYTGVEEDRKKFNEYLKRMSEEQDE